MKKSIVCVCIVLLLIFLLTGCPSNMIETYTVWTDTATYYDFQSAFETTLNDGMYISTEFTSSQWEQLSRGLTDEDKHVWTKEKIQDWLLGRGFGNSESIQAASWLTTINHGILASRTGNIVSIIVK